jgi:prophage regulatory protein
MKVLSYKDLKQVAGIPWSRTHLNRLEADGLFPTRVYVSARRIGWLESDVQGWLKKRVAISRSMPPRRGPGRPPAQVAIPAEIPA